jgi:hypothetical protein
LKGVLVRVGIDQTFGGWNAPVDPHTLEFAYVPIPDGPQRPGLATPYALVGEALARFPAATMPDALLGRSMHLDPDFAHLTYGDDGDRRGRGVARLARGDFLAFFASLRPTRRIDATLLYALIGFYRVREVVRATSVPRARWGENAHTRRAHHAASDVIVRAEREGSGRLRRCIPIGGWRDGCYRVRPDLLARWGPLSCRDGFLQRSAVPPSFREPERFLAWFASREPELVADNNP